MEHDALELSSFEYKSKQQYAHDNSPNTFGSHGCAHFGHEQYLVFMSAIENSAQNSHKNGHNPHSNKWHLVKSTMQSLTWILQDTNSIKNYAYPNCSYR